jgi:hypothetical protein
MSSCHVRFVSRRTFAPQNVMSALPPKADIRCALSFAKATSGRGQRSKTLSTVTFFVDQEGKSPSVPIWSKVDSLTRIHIPNMDGY